MARPKGPPPLLPTHAEAFLTDASETPKTESTYRTGLINLQRFALDAKLTLKGTPLPPQAISQTFLADYFSWMRSVRRYRNATIRLYLTIAGQYLNWLDGNGSLAPGVNVAALRAAAEKKTGRRARRLRPERRGSDDSVGALLAYYQAELASIADAKPSRQHQQRLILLRNHAILHTLYATAGRVAEIASLQRADVAGGRATQVEITGKGGRRRIIFLTTPAQHAIQAYLHARADSAAYLFVSHGAHKERPLTTQAIWQVVNRAAKAVFGTDSRGRPLRRVGPHAFRHLRAQHLSDEGMPITSLQALLGHASISTTRDIYAPKTRTDTLLEELATYGRDPNEVIADGEAAAEAIRHQPHE